MPLFLTIPFLLIILSGNSIAPTNILTASLWIVAIGWALFPLILGTPKQHKARNMEEAEWYISNYKRIWFSKDQYQAISRLGTYSQMSKDRDSYRGRKYIQLYEDLWLNYERKWLYKMPLKDTYKSTYHWMAICNPQNGDMYCPQYFNIVNNEEKLKAWEPSMEINMG